MPCVVNEFGAMPAAPDAFDLRLVDLGGGEAMVEVHMQWDFVDAWLPTASRPEGAQDGMHYRPPTCAALMDVFLHGLCREGADAMEVSGCATNSN